MNNRYSWPYNLAYDIFGEEQRFKEILPMRLQHVVNEELSARESKCIHLRYEEEQSYDTIAKSFNVTRERIRQIVMRAIGKLRHPKWANKYLAVPRYEYNRVVQENVHLKLYLDRLEDETSSMSVEERSAILAFLDTPIEELNLSVRAYNCLVKRSDFSIYRDFQNYKIRNFLNIRNLGNKSLVEILDKLSKIGFKAQEGDHIYDLHEWNDPYSNAILVWKGDK